MNLNLINILETKLRIPCNSLTDKEISVIHQMIREHPRNFSKIEFGIEKIIADDKVNIKGIQEFIPLICMLFSNPIYENVTRIEFLNIIQFIMEVILDSGYINIPEGDISSAKVAVKKTIRLLIRTDERTLIFWLKSLFSCSPFKK
jgi:hypothetical protein